MGFFGNKKNVVDEQTRELNELLNTALEFNQQTGTWTDFPDNVLPETKEQVIAARKLILEYIRQDRKSVV